MKKNFYFETVYPRRNAILEQCYRIFQVGSSHARLVLEVFIRKNMGWRYFSITSVTSIALFLIGVPLFIFFSGITTLYLLWHSIEVDFKLVLFILWILSNFFTWLKFTHLFIKASLLRYRETKKDRTNFDLTKYSKYSGDILQETYNRKLFNIPNNTRTLRIFYEPFPFFAAGLGLIVLGQFIGFVLIFCSIMYSLAYIGSIYRADIYISEISDNIIIAREAKEAFTQRKSPRDSCGLEFNCDIPDDPDVRERVAREFEQETYATFVY